MTTVIASQTYARINITLPARTLSLMNRVIEKGERSQVIDAAVLEYLNKKSKDNLRKLIREGALKNATRDRTLAEDWFPLEEEVWGQKK